MKKLVSLILIAVLVVSLSGCFFGYGGEHEDLYTVAIYNVFGAYGYRSNVHEIVEMENIYEEIMKLKGDCGWDDPWPEK